MLCFFFFQAEDGIRDADVTGVQTCALPISSIKSISAAIGPASESSSISRASSQFIAFPSLSRQALIEPGADGSLPFPRVFPTCAPPRQRVFPEGRKE